MSSLFKQVTVSLLAVAAAATLCAPTRAATAAWVYCAGGSQTSVYGTIYQVYEQVSCTMSTSTMWTTAEYHNNRLGGGDDNQYTNNAVSMYGPGTDYDPTDGYYANTVKGGGTYNCWCICSGGDSSNVKWYASTGGTTYVSF